MAQPPPPYPAPPGGPPPWPPAPGWGAQPWPPPRKKHTGLIISVVVGVVVILAVVATVLVVHLRSQSAASDNAAALQKVITTYTDNFNNDTPSQNLAAGVYCDPLDDEQKFTESLNGVVSFLVRAHGKPVVDGDHARIDLDVTYSGPFPIEPAALQVLELDKRSAGWCVSSFTFNADVVDGTGMQGDALWIVQQFIWSLSARDYGSVNNYTCALSMLNYGDVTSSTVTWGVVTDGVLEVHGGTYSVSVRLGRKDGDATNATVVVEPASGHYCVKGLA